MTADNCRHGHAASDALLLRHASVPVH
jgi:hypothetical protein